MTLTLEAIMTLSLWLLNNNKNISIQFIFNAYGKSRIQLIYQAKEINGSQELFN